jgi:hypothetical protein
LLALAQSLKQMVSGKRPAQKARARQERLRSYRCSAVENQP